MSGDVKNREFTWLSVILQKDPDFYAKRKSELLYEFTGRNYRGDPTRVGTAYPITEYHDE